jgi:hypothetical protein
MDKNILKNILQNKELFVPLILTQKQFSTLKKYDQNIPLSNAEKKAIYTSITKKMKALATIKIEQENEWYIQGADKIVTGRIEKAKAIISEYATKHSKVFISGSFLFSKKYNDIDIFIVRERGYKEEYKDDHHIIFIPEKRLSKPVFQSAALISVSTFNIPFKKGKITLKLGEFMSSYHEAVIEIMSNQERELTRYIIFTYYYKIKKKMLNGKELQKKTQETTIPQLELMVKSVLNQFFSKKYLYVAIYPYIKNLSEFIESEKNVANLKKYKAFYEELIYDTRRSTAKA